MALHIHDIVAPSCMVVIGLALKLSESREAGRSIELCVQSCQVFFSPLDTRI